MAFSGDDSRCPICEEKNNCASVQGREIEKCWCMQKVLLLICLNKFLWKAEGKRVYASNALRDRRKKVGINVKKGIISYGEAFIDFIAKMNLTLTLTLFRRHNR